MANEIVNQEKAHNVSNYLANVNLKKRFEGILGKKAAGFMASIVNVSNLPGLKDVQPLSIISSAIVAATLDLPIDPNLGFAYIVPYSTKVDGEYIKKGQFQMGYKGFIQLAIRTGKYKTINAIPIYEGDIKHTNKLTGEIELNDENTNADKVIGYIAYFRLINGFEKMLYMTADEMEKHAKKYSQTYKSNKDYIVKSSKWTTDFDSMAIKTVLKLLLSKYGILSIEMQTAIQTDQGIIKDNVADGAEISQDNIDYADNEDIQDVEYEPVSTKLDDKFKKKEEPQAEQNEFEGSPFGSEGDK